MTLLEEETSSTRIFFLFPSQLSWWLWLVTATLLAAGLAGLHDAYLIAFVLSVLQTLGYYLREGRLAAFPVQLRSAYTLLLVLCFLSPGHRLFWLPVLGTLALNIFGYCLMARVLSLLPWNRREPLTAELVGRTFLSRPRTVTQEQVGGDGCSGGVCSIEAQVRQRRASPATAAPQFE